MTGPDCDEPGGSGWTIPADVRADNARPNVPDLLFFLVDEVDEPHLVGWSCQGIGVRNVGHSQVVVAREFMGYEREDGTRRRIPAVTLWLCEEDAAFDLNADYVSSLGEIRRVLTNKSLVGGHSAPTTDGEQSG